MRSTKATQLHSIGQLAGWVGSCVLGTAKHGLAAGHGQPAHKDSPTVVLHLIIGSDDHRIR